MSGPHQIEMFSTAMRLPRIDSGRDVRGFDYPTLQSTLFGSVDVTCELGRIETVNIPTRRSTSFTIKKRSRWAMESKTLTERLALRPLTGSGRVLRRTNQQRPSRQIHTTVKEGVD